MRRNILIFCCVIFFLDMYINYYLGLLQTECLANYNNWKEIDEITETYFF
jgi:hypothetical protein